MEYRLDRDIHSLLDPRTKLLLLFTSSIFVVGNAGEKWMVVFYWILVYLPVVLLFAEKEWKAGVVAVVIYIGSYYAQMTLQHDLTMTKILPTVILARYIIKTTRVSEFLTAMNRLHVSDKLTIPISVVFRFFPTIAEEYRSINDAMRMRGVEMGAKKAVLAYTVKDTDVEKKLTLLEIELITGRFHQIRAQLSHMGYPIAGDKKYGAGDTDNPLPKGAIGLCAVSLSFNHPVTGKRMDFDLSPPYKPEDRHLHKSGIFYTIL